MVVLGVCAQTTLTASTGSLAWSECGGCFVAARRPSQRRLAQREQCAQPAIDAAQRMPSEVRAEGMHRRWHAELFSCRVHLFGDLCVVVGGGCPVTLTLLPALQRRQEGHCRCGCPHRCASPHDCSRCFPAQPYYASLPVPFTTTTHCADTAPAPYRARTMASRGATSSVCAIPGRFSPTSASTPPASDGWLARCRLSCPSMPFTLSCVRLTSLVAQTLVEQGALLVAPSPHCSSPLLPSCPSHPHTPCRPPHGRPRAALTRPLGWQPLPDSWAQSPPPLSRPSRASPSPRPDPSESGDTCPRSGSCPARAAFPAVHGRCGERGTRWGRSTC